MALPASGYLSDLARTQGEMRVALEDQRDVIAGLETSNLPAGGTPGQVLVKTGGADYAVAWQTPASSDVLWVGASAPVDPAIELWWDTSDTSP